MDFATMHGSLPSAMWFGVLGLLSIELDESRLLREAVLRLSRTTVKFD